MAEALAAAEIIIHATPIGMTPKTDASIVPADQIRPTHVVFDVVYTPLETKLLRDAKAAGAKAVPGIGMFVHQAAIQFEMWTGRDAPIDVMTQTVKEALEKTTMNLVLIGYRGTGKTVIGKLLAADLNMPYVGLDAAIVDRAGMPIPEIVSRHGWDFFRDLEQQVVEEATARRRPGPRYRRRRDHAGREHRTAPPQRCRLSARSHLGGHRRADRRGHATAFADRREELHRRSGGRLEGPRAPLPGGRPPCRRYLNIRSRHRGPDHRRLFRRKAASLID